MTVVQRPATKWTARIAAAGVAAASVPLLWAGPANAATVTCTAPTEIFAAKANGDLWIYQDAAPATGGGTFQDIHQNGSGWAGRTLAGANGDVFNITPSGELHYLHYNTATDSWSNNATAVDLGGGWSRYLSGTGANQITVDATGHIFAVDAAGVLRSYSYNATTGKLDNAAGTVVDSGWAGYTRIFAGGDNVLYAVDATGNLFRFRIDTTAQEFTEYADEIGNGFGTVANVFSPGGDVLYVTDSAGSLFWFRYNDDTQSWDNNGAGKRIGSGWNTFTNVSATTNTCSVPAPAPVAPTTPAASTATDPLALGATTPGGLPVYFYNSGGTIDYTQDDGATGLSGPVAINGSYPGPVSVADVAGTSGIDISAAAIENTGVVDLGSSTGDLQTLSPIGGSMRTVALTGNGRQLQVFGVGGEGHLWGRVDTGAPGGLTLWHDLTPGLNGTTGTLSGPLAVGTSGSSTYGVATLSTGGTGFFSSDGTTLTATALPDSDQYGLPAVTDKAAVPTLFAAAKAADSQVSVYTTAGGWAALPHLPGSVHVASAPVSSALVSSGDIAVAVLGSDGYVYATNQIAAGTYGQWQRVGNKKSAIAPTLFSSNNSGVDLAFRGKNDGKIYHYAAPAPAAGSALTFTGGGHSFG